MSYKVKKKRKNSKDMKSNNSSRRFRSLGKAMSNVTFTASTLLKHKMTIPCQLCHQYKDEFTAVKIGHPQTNISVRPADRPSTRTDWQGRTE